MTTSFLLIRHAEHVHYNRRLSGRMEGVALSAEGRTQADALAKRLAMTAIDRIVASPLERTRETALAIAAGQVRQPQVETDPGLLELDMGDWAGREIGGFGDDPAWHAWNDHRGSARIPGGETMGEAQARIVDALAGMAAASPDRTVAVVSHADMIRAVVAHVIDLPLDNLLRFDIDPASVTRLIWGDWGARLLSLNEGVDA